MFPIVCMFQTHQNQFLKFESIGIFSLFSFPLFLCSVKTNFHIIQYYQWYELFFFSQFCSERCQLEHNNFKFGVRGERSAMYCLDCWAIRATIQLRTSNSHHRFFYIRSKHWVDFFFVFPVCLLQALHCFLYVYYILKISKRKNIFLFLFCFNYLKRI